MKDGNITKKKKIKKMEKHVMVHTDAYILSHSQHGIFGADKQTNRKYGQNSRQEPKWIL